MPHILQRALDPRVAPRRIVLRHSDDEPLDLRKHAATSASGGIRPFPGDELSVPPENRVGRDDGRDPTKPSAAYPVSMYGQPAAFIIGEADPTVQVRAEDAVFFDQIGDGRVGLVGPPAGHRHHEESNHGDIHDRGSLYHRLNIAPANYLG